MKTVSLPRTTVWQGEAGTVRTLYIKNDDGTDFDGSGLTLKISGSVADVAMIEDVALGVVDAANGEYTYTTTAAETATTGDLICQVRITDGGTGVDYTGQFVFEVTAPIYNT